MNNILIREAKIEDLNSIQKLNYKLFEHEYNEYDNALNLKWPISEEGALYFTKLITEQKVFIACDDFNTVGYLAGILKLKETYFNVNMAEIENMYVEEKYRSIGLGTMLINEFKKYCVNVNIQDVTVTASSMNAKAINFYKKNGFNNYNLTLKCKM